MAQIFCVERTKNFTVMSNHHYEYGFYGDTEYIIREVLLGEENRKTMKTYSSEKDVNIAQNILRRNMQYDEYNNKIRNLIDNNIEKRYCVAIKKTIAQTIS